MLALEKPPLIKIILLTSATGLINDLIARLHRYDMFLKNLHAENLTLKQEKEKNK